MKIFWASVWDAFGYILQDNIYTRASPLDHLWLPLVTSSWSCASRDAIYVEGNINGTLTDSMWLGF